MLKAVSTVLAVVVSLAIVGNFAAAQERLAAKGPRGGQSYFDRIEKIKGLNLTDDQKAKIAELKKEYAPKLKEISDEARRRADGGAEEGPRGSHEGGQGSRQERPQRSL